MPELLTPILPLALDYVCDACKAGYMHHVPDPRNSIHLLNSSPDLGILHRCLNCRDEKYFQKRYPAVFFPKNQKDYKFLITVVNDAPE